MSFPWEGKTTEDAFDTNPKMSGEQRLFRAVIIDAVIMAVSKPRAAVGKAAIDQERKNERERKFSRLFCTAEKGEWAKHREYICNLAGINSEYVRDKTLAFIASGHCIEVRDGRWWTIESLNNSEITCK